jgi:hypothetical protein
MPIDEDCGRRYARIRVFVATRRRSGTGRRPWRRAGRRGSATRNRLDVGRAGKLIGYLATVILAEGPTRRVRMGRQDAERGS